MFIAESSDWQSLIDLWDHLLESSLDPELAIKAYKESMLQPVHDDVEVLDDDEHFHDYDSRPPSPWAPINVAQKGDILPPVTPTWTGGSGSPVSTASSTSVYSDISLDIQVARICPKPKKVSRIGRFFRGVRGLFQRSKRSEREGWNKL
ncbi:uncharacterized protein LOC124291664 [Haliotis rubra]|uniref:uncharacterized protein LOC124291664 n=1 Tax=Haliotis rubra TaxID=36100 RepID=UPI001EE55080|nr:uncharacterized protein LOC124291664 [Haliotis rubra]